jgi:hypothetical protein
MKGIWKHDKNHNIYNHLKHELNSLNNWFCYRI